ncbi:MAG: adenosine deaminase [Clostridiales bacterium]|nr:adenosine deaminase [Clostridiales bacterium]MDN5282465.1 adenosine deaminase [Candidatus Ozemobacter sp.]
MKNKALLLGTLGGSWSIVPEVLGFTNPGQIKLFAQREDLGEISEGLPQIDEVWLATTNGDISKSAAEKLRAWQALLGKAAPPIRIWAPEKVDDLTSQKQADSMREMIWRLALRACDERGSENVCFCLAGGRKTMSADLQTAATLFGSSMLLHLIETGFLPEHLRNKPEPKTFANELSKEDAMLFKPVILDRNLPKAEIIELKGENDGQSVNSTRFPIAMAPTDGMAFPVIVENDLKRTIEERRKRARNLLYHYAGTLTQSTAGQPFQALYVLPPAVITKLKADRIGVDPIAEKDELIWLEKLPKTDLHCHLGGVADAMDLIRIAKAMREDLDKAATPELMQRQKEWRAILLGQGPAALKEQIHKSADGYKADLKRIAQETRTKPWAVNTALISIFADLPSLLEEFIFGKYLNSENFVKIGILKYEALGDMQGSSLLQSESAIREMCRVLIEKCRKENISYIEVRCSPVNYTQNGLSETQIVQIVQSELAKALPQLHSSLIIIGSRHRKFSDCCRHVELATDILNESWYDARVPIVGFDLAGDEAFEPEKFAPIFRPLFEKCLHITVHAGETQSVESIWKAVYTLNAERIGHGLELANMPKLVDHFLDRGIGVEMCPSSNFQIVGFKDRFIETSDRLKIYPLKKYLDMGLKVCVNTDNPGISRTNSSLELHRAARLIAGGLSRWDILQLIKNGFSASFVSYEKGREILLKAEKEILTILGQEHG